MPFKKSKKIVRKSKKKVRKGKRKNTTRKLMKKTIKRGGGQGSSSLAPSKVKTSKVSSKASSKVSSKEKMSPIPELSTIKSVSPVSDILPIGNSTIPDLVSIEKIEPFGPPSNNGFIHMIETNNGMNAILKSSQTLEQQEGYLMKPDNLMYEYLVGQYINTLNSRFPCFLQTYGLYKYSNDLTYQKLMGSKKSSDVTSDDVKNIEKVNVNYKNLSETLNIACKNDQHMAILLQYLPNIESISSMLQKNKLTERELITSLYQVYFVLSVLQNEFTHYDLHARNVQLYEVPEGKYIQYHYHSRSGDVVVSFKSKYLVKIIDYSRCFFIQNDLFSSGIINLQLYRAKDCITHEESGKAKPAGIDFGFHWLTQEAPPKNEKEKQEQHFINSTLLNISHDLRLLQDITHLKRRDEKKQTSSLNKFLNHVYYKNKFGTPNQNKPIEGKKIVNVSSAEKGLNNIITNHEKYNEVPPETSELLCTLKIYYNGKDMEMELPEE